MRRGRDDEAMEDAPPAKRARVADSAAEWLRRASEQHLLDALPKDSRCLGCDVTTHVLGRFMATMTRTDGGGGRVCVLGMKHGSRAYISVPKLRDGETGLDAEPIPEITDASDPRLPTVSWRTKMPARATPLERVTAEFWEDKLSRDVRWNFDADRLSAIFASDPHISALVMPAVTLEEVRYAWSHAQIFNESGTFIIVKKLGDGLVLSIVPTSLMAMRKLLLDDIERAHPRETEAVRAGRDIPMDAALRREIADAVEYLRKETADRLAVDAALTRLCRILSNHRFTTTKSESGLRTVTVRRKRNATQIVYQRTESALTVAERDAVAERAESTRLRLYRIAVCTSMMLSIGADRVGEAAVALEAASGRAGIHVWDAMERLSYNMVRLFGDGPYAYCCTDPPSSNFAPEWWFFNRSSQPKAWYTVDGTRLTGVNRLAVEAIARSET